MRTAFALMLAVASCFSALTADATALKVCNDTNRDWRVTVDGGAPQWFPVQPDLCRTASSGPCDGWGNIATHTGERFYHVVFSWRDVDGAWIQAFAVEMWGGWRTNVAQILWTDRPTLQFWWEFGNRGKCRDKPPYRNRPSCLISHEEVEQRQRESESKPERQYRGGRD